MSDVFDDTLTAAAENLFLLPGAETVTYRPASGSNRSISAVVTRPEPDRVPQVTVLVRNSETAGISSEEINTGGDKIELARRVGESAKILRITNIIDQDAGFMLLAAS